MEIRTDLMIAVLYECEFALTADEIADELGLTMLQLMDYLYIAKRDSLLKFDGNTYLTTEKGRQWAEKHE